MSLCCGGDERISDLPLKSSHKIQSNVHQEKQKARKNLRTERNFVQGFGFKVQGFSDRNSEL